MRPHHREHRDHPETCRRLHHDTTPDCIDVFDDMVARAATGDRSALGTLATGCEHFLLEEARRELGPRYQHEAITVLVLVFESLSRGRLKIAPGRGASFAWMKQTTRKFAKLHLEKRQRPAWREPANEQTEQNEKSELAFRKSAGSGL
jgi:hypothetical protein